MIKPANATVLHRAQYQGQWSVAVVVFFRYLHVSFFVVSAGEVVTTGCRGRSGKSKTVAWSV